MINIQIDNGCRKIYISGSLTVNSVSETSNIFNAIAETKLPEQIQIDLSGVSFCDSAGIAWLVNLVKNIESKNIKAELINIPESVVILAKLFNLKKFNIQPKNFLHKRVSVFERIGEAGIKFFNDTCDMLTFLGALVIAVFSSLKRIKEFRFNDLVALIERVGFDALPIVSLISFLIGITIAFLGASQLSQFGANIYVPNLVAIAIIQELGPLITAVVVAGRTGASYAAEIGTMKVYEEISALISMGFDPMRFLVVPRVFAMAISMPCLLVITIILGIFGGAVICAIVLGIPISAYYNQVYDMLSSETFIRSFFKTFIFAILIASVSCLRGMSTQGSADSVGKSTTSAVVSSIFLIIIANAVFTIIYNYL